MSCIQCMNVCLVINKHVLLRIFWPYFPHYYFWHIHMIGVFTFHLILFTCVFIWGNFPSTYLYVYHFKEGEILYIGVLISRSYMHVVPNSNIACTSETLYNFLCMLISKSSLWIKLHITLHLWFDLEPWNF